jgi:hypothetical protein
MVASTVPCYEVGMGHSESRRILSCRLWSGCVLWPGITSPGTIRGEPYNISADEQPESSLGAVLMPNNTHGSSCVQLGPVGVLVEQT